MPHTNYRSSNQSLPGNPSATLRALIFGTAVVSASLTAALAPVQVAIAATNAAAARTATARPRTPGTSAAPSTAAGTAIPSRRSRPVIAPVAAPVVPAVPEVVEAPVIAPVGLDEDERRLLHNQIVQLRDDQRARAAQIAQLARDPRVLRSPRLLPIATRLAQQQLETSLVMQRTDRFIASADPRLKSYEAMLGEEIVQSNRLAHVLFVAAQIERIEFETAHEPRPATQCSCETGPSIIDLDRAYDTSVAAFAMFHQNFLRAVRDVPADHFVAINVTADVSHVPRSELLFTMAHFLVTRTVDALAFSQILILVGAPTGPEFQAALAETGFAQEADPPIAFCACSIDDVSRMEQDFAVAPEPRPVFAERAPAGDTAVATETALFPTAQPPRELPSIGVAAATSPGDRATTREWLASATAIEPGGYVAGVGGWDPAWGPYPELPHEPVNDALYGPGDQD